MKRCYLQALQRVIWQSSLSGEMALACERGLQLANGVLTFMDIQLFSGKLKRVSYVYGRLWLCG